MKPRHWPLSFLFFTFLGLVATGAAISVFTGLAAAWHPLLADEFAGWGLLVSAIALFLSGAFPLVLRRLAEREGA